MDSEDEDQTEGKGKGEGGQVQVEEGGLVGRIVVKGMEGSKAEQNELKGNADKYDRKAGRYCVTLDNGKKVMFRPGNLVRDTAKPKAKEEKADHSEDGDIEE